jgi:DNA-binding MarR family transcriptional regulator
MPSSTPSSTVRRQVTADEYRSLAELRYRIRRFIHFSEQAARASGLEAQQHQLLLAIKGLPRGESPTISAIAARLVLAHNSTQELVRRAEGRQLVTTRHDLDDRRQVLVELTEDGEVALRELSIAHLEELRSEAVALTDWLAGFAG